MRSGTRKVGKRLRGRRRSAFIESGSARASRDAVATTKRMSIKPSVFHRPTNQCLGSSFPAASRPKARVATMMSPHPPGTANARGQRPVPIVDEEEIDTDEARQVKRDQPAEIEGQEPSAEAWQRDPYH